MTTKVDCRQILLHDDEVACITRHAIRTVRRKLPVASKIGKCKMYALSDVIDLFAPDRPLAAQRLLVDALLVIKNGRPTKAAEADPEQVRPGDCPHCRIRSIEPMATERKKSDA